MPPHLNIDAATTLPIQRSRPRFAASILVGADMRWHAGAKESSIQCSRNRKNRVADGFCFEPSDGDVVQQFVFGISLGSHRIGLARHGISAAQQQHPMDGFDRPSARNEMTRYEIEQLRMGWYISVLTKVIHRTHNAVAKMVLPDAVY